MAEESNRTNQEPSRCYVKSTNPKPLRKSSLVIVGDDLTNSNRRRRLQISNSDEDVFHRVPTSSGMDASAPIRGSHHEQHDDHIDGDICPNINDLMKEKSTYDLMFETDSKFLSETSKNLESSSTPLNITILDPAESGTNANYQHLFENNNSEDKKTCNLFARTNQIVKLSEVNLKTSIPCVDFTTLPAPPSALVTKQSNPSLNDCGMDKNDKN